MSPPGRPLPRATSRAEGEGRGPTRPDPAAWLHEAASGPALRAHRKAAGLTQVELAWVLGVHREAVIVAEAGRGELPDRCRAELLLVLTAGRRPEPPAAAREGRADPVARADYLWRLCTTAPRPGAS